MDRRPVQYQYQVAPRQPYFHGTDGSSALAGSPQRQQQPRPRPPQAPQYYPPQQLMHTQSATTTTYRRHHGVYARRWVVLLVAIVAVVFMIVSLADINIQKSTLAREIDRQRVDLANIQARDKDLDAALEEGVDEVQLRSVAVNRMGMQVPNQNQIYRVPVPYVIVEEAATDIGADTSKAGASLFNLFLSLFQN